ncbi:MAG: flagellin, partial [Thermoguttaceae bacterium]
MTRINTNVSSLNAQKSLARANVSLQEALTRLSTGLRINVGKDDPAGLIASEVLRSDITAVKRAITNSERANQMIATADSALGQVSGLLNDIRGLVTESANTGALSAEQIAANQLQVDSSLSAINRIAATTSFQGRKLLDGTLAFTYTETSGFTGNNVTDLQINQATIGSTGSEAIAVDITAAATQGVLLSTVPGIGAGTKSAVVWDINAADTVTITADVVGTEYDSLVITVIESAGIVDGETVAFYDGTSGARTLDIYTSDVGSPTTTTSAKLLIAINAAAGADYTATESNAAGTLTEGSVYLAVADTAGGVDTTDGLTNALVLEISGDKGTEVLQFGALTTGATMEAAIDMVSASTGVTAGFAGTTLTFTSSNYGTNAFVALNVISETGGTTFGDTIGVVLDDGTMRKAGTDVAATVNGIGAIGNGNSLTVSSSVLSMDATVADGSSTDFAFTITGGGALFQIGPDVNTANQARMGIQSVNAGTLQGSSGRLYTVGSGEANAMGSDVITAAEIVDQVIVKVTSLRGRLGAFQKTTLETNINSLTDTLENLMGAESS